MPFEFWQIANWVIRSLINLEIAWVATQLLPMSARNRKILYGVAFAQIALAWAVENWGPSVLNPLGFVLFYAVLPFLLWRGGRGERLVCSVVVLLIVLACEALALLVLSLVGIDLYGADEEAPVVMLACRIVYMGLMALFARIASLLIARARNGGDDGPLGWYGLFLAAQVVMLNALWFVAFASELADPNALSGFVLTIACCFAADVVALVSLERHGAALRERQRANLLESRLSGYLEESRDLVVGAADVARFRHDWRNHLQVVRDLVARGEADEARAYISDLRAQLAAGQGAQLAAGSSDAAAASAGGTPIAALAKVPASADKVSVAASDGASATAGETPIASCAAVRGEAFATPGASSDVATMPGATSDAAAALAFAKGEVSA